jgi:hypothetical protein
MRFAALNSGLQANSTSLLKPTFATAARTSVGATTRWPITV